MNRLCFNRAMMTRAVAIVATLLAPILPAYRQYRLRSMPFRSIRRRVFQPDPRTRHAASFHTPSKLEGIPFAASHRHRYRTTCAPRDC
jgi:hypothetical protein